VGFGLQLFITPDGDEIRTDRTVQVANET